MFRGIRRFCSGKQSVRGNMVYCHDHSKELVPFVEPLINPYDVEIEEKTVPVGKSGWSVFVKYAKNKRYRARGKVDITIVADNSEHLVLNAYNTLTRKGHDLLMSIVEDKTIRSMSIEQITVMYDRRIILIKVAIEDNE